MRMNLDSPIINFLSRAWDVMITAVLYVITCLPIVTIGAASTAMHSTVMAICNDSCSGVLAKYFGTFKEEFKQSTLLWLGLAVVLALLVGDYVACIVFPADNSLRPLMLGVTFVFAVFYILMFTYIYAIVARYIVTWKQALRNALYLITKYPLTALGVLLINALHIFAYYLWMILALPVTPFLLFFQEALINRIINKEQGVVKEKKRRKSDYDTYED